MIKIAVILASYNGVGYIEEQIQSILAQEKVQIKIFVSDDCSSDGTVQLVAEKFPEVSITVNAKGSGSAANNFLNFVKFFDKTEEFDYYAFSDQDDIWLKDKLLRAVTMLQDNNAALYLSNLKRWNMHSNKYSIIKKDFPQKKFDHLFEGGSAGCTYVFTKEFCSVLQHELKKVSDMYSGWWGFSHDWLVYFIARNSQLKVYIDGEPKIIYRIHDYNVYGQLNENSITSIRKRLDLIKKGWYIYHMAGLAPLIIDETSYKICSLYTKNMLTRFYVLTKYNFELMRSRTKFLQFVVLSLLFTPYLSKAEFRKYFSK